MLILLPFLSSLLAGAVTTLAIPPFSYWWLAVPTLATLAYNCHKLQTKKPLFIHALLFGLGFLGTGASWVFVSIHEFGNTAWFLAGLMTALFVFVNALAFALPFCILAFFKPTHLRLLLGFPLVWVLNEWLRSWLFTGFPWLYLGYAHLETPLAGWAPIGGVFSLSLLAAFYASAFCILCLHKSSANTLKLICVAGMVMFWVEGKALKSFQWTQADGEPLSVGLVQPNIPQTLKWAPEYKQPTLDILASLTDSLEEIDLIVWPEAAVPDVFFRSTDFLSSLHEKTKNNDSGLITGILYDDQGQGRYFNSLVGVGEAEGIYHKQRLVPFGEYVPLETYLRGLINFLSLPTSVISQGPSDQEGIKIKNHRVASAICYEIVYPELVATETKNKHLIVTVSNDAWFGNSIGPLQHFHMVRMRALETGRYVVRATNNGVSAIITPKGDIQQQSEQFIRTTLFGEVTPMSGNTPYLIWKNYFILSLLLIIFIVLLVQTQRKN